MKRKPILDDDDEFEIDTGDDDEQSDSESLDALFDAYYTPDIQDEDPDLDEHFLPAITRDTEAMLVDFEKADIQQRLAENKNADIVSRVKNIVQSGVDYNYFFCIVFVSEAQKKQFIEESGWARYGGARFLNGVEMARDMGIELKPDYVAPVVKPDRRLASRSRNQE